MVYIDENRSKSFHFLKDIHDDVNGLIEIKQSPNYKNPAYPTVEDLNKRVSKSFILHIHKYNNLNADEKLKPQGMDLVNLIAFKRIIESRLEGH